MPAPGMHSGRPIDESMNLSMSAKGLPLYEAVVAFVRDEVDPVTEEYYRLGEGRAEHWGYGDGQLELLDSVKAKAKAAGLWNFFLPNAETGEGLSNLDYAYIAAELGKNPIASECLNCSAPDTGNMEVLERVGTPEQKEQWLEPLLAGEIRSAFAMTEPDVASSDATNIATPRRARRRRVGHQRREVLHLRRRRPPLQDHDRDGDDQPRRAAAPSAVADPRADGHARASRSSARMHVFGEDDAPHGHMHLRFTDVRVPKDNILLGEGRGFEISQVRLGPGRIHHCMRSIGAAERALELMIRRGLNREAFGKPLARLGKNIEVIAKARIEIEAMRLMVLRAAKAMDTMGNAEARVWVSAVKAMVPDPGLRDHRRGHPDARRHRRLAVDAARAHVRGTAHAAPGRRARRGALARGRSRRARPIRRRHRPQRGGRRPPGLTRPEPARADQA